MDSTNISRDKASEVLNWTGDLKLFQQNESNDWKKAKPSCNVSNSHLGPKRRLWKLLQTLIHTAESWNYGTIENLLSIPLSHITHFQGSKPESLHILPIVFVIYLVYHGRPKSSSTYFLAFIIRINEVTGVCIIALIDHYIKVLLRGNITNRLLSTERPSDMQLVSLSHKCSPSSSTILNELIKMTNDDVCTS